MKTKVAAAIKGLLRWFLKGGGGAGLQQLRTKVPDRKVEENYVQLLGEAGGGPRCWPGFSGADLRAADDRPLLGTEGSKCLQLYSRAHRLRRAALPEPVGPVLDEPIAGRALAAVEPAALEASLAAVAGVERERSELARHWQLRRERARLEVDRAARQHQACEPENRLVGRELERRWEESLKARSGWRTSTSGGSGRPPADSRTTTSG